MMTKKANWDGMIEYSWMIWSKKENQNYTSKYMIYDSIEYLYHSVCDTEQFLGYL